MIEDFDTLPDAALDLAAADVCIVGAGAVGLSMACALARQGRRVVVLEGGGPRLESDSQALQRGESVGHPFKNIEVGRYRVLGGTTTYWGGQLYPFDAFVTQARPWIDHEAWPIDADALHGWHAQAYALLGLQGVEQDDAAVWSLLGQSAPALGADLEMPITRWVKTRNLARHFAADLRSPQGPRVVTHANVVGLRCEPGGGRIDAVTVRSLKGRQATLPVRELVLATGTIEVARLLLHPPADGQCAPWQASRWLGAPLIDHLDCSAGDVHVRDHRRFHDLFDNIYAGGHKYYPKLRLARETQRREGLVDIAGQFLYPTRVSEHLAYLKMFARSLRDGSAGVSLTQLPHHVAAVAATAWPLALRYFRDRRSFKPQDAEVNLMLYTEQLPNPRSRVRLGAHTDALGMRRVEVDWQIDGLELRTMRRFAELVGQQLETMGLATLAIDPLLRDGDPAFAGHIQDAVHQMGTTRIGRSAEHGVVDADLRVFGTTNLHVAGAAVFPSTGFANPTLTAIALALRLADRLVRKAIPA